MIRERAPGARDLTRRVGRNALLLVLGAVLIAMAGEAWLRLTVPFMRRVLPLESVPNVGCLMPPNTEIPHTNGLDFWNVSRTNSLGFVAREPPSPGRAAATCHISMIGDSFVEALQVHSDDKFQVRLEELAADELPRLNITTSAFGMRGTGQVQQLPFYDEYARLLHPKLLVLVFSGNDFTDNTPILQSLTSRRRQTRECISERVARRRLDGRLELAWSSPQDRLPWSSRTRLSWAARAMEEVVNRSWLAAWLREKEKALFPPDLDPGFIRNAEALRRQPGHAALLEGWRPTTRRAVTGVFDRKDLPPVFEDALQYTHFALEQFRQRADRDGARLVILASHVLRYYGPRMFERMSEIATSLDIPVIDQADYILRQGAKISDANWPHDGHWNPAGHRWAAEALLEYIEEHPAICDG